MNWLKEVAKAGLEVGVGVATGGTAAVPKIVDEAVSHLGRKKDPSRGAAFAAAGIREILSHTVPDEALGWIDRFCVRWAQLVGSARAMKDENLEILKGYEGFSGTPYMDTAGHRSIGYGHNLDVSPLPGDRDYNAEPLTEAEAEAILSQDVEAAEQALERIVPDVMGLIPQDKREVLIRMSFQMGAAGVAKFRNMIAALKDHDYPRAAAEMLDSRWARQVPRRAGEEAERMRA